VSDPIALEAVVVRDSSFTGNTAEAGGALYGIATLTTVTVSGNTAITGGGVFLAGGGRLTGVTISGNVAGGPNGAGSGGGVVVAGGAASLTNVTISGNTARPDVSGGAGRGGGIVAEPGVTSATLTNVSVVANAAGVASGLDGGEYTLENTILANSPAAGNCPAGGVISLGHNLDSGSSCGLNGPGDLRNVDPRLGPLADNGSATRTHALLPGSPALDAGTNDGCPATDQRGLPRPRDANRDGIAVCDIGAFELQPRADTHPPRTTAAVPRVPTRRAGTPPT
jgi:hypothetical protein